MPTDLALGAGGSEHHWLFYSLFGLFKDSGDLSMDLMNFSNRDQNPVLRHLIDYSILYVSVLPRVVDLY